MAFQFYCPHGHLLQGEESQVGQTCVCPYCQTEFLIPTPPPGAEPAGSPVIPAEEPEQYFEPEAQEDSPVMETREERPGASEFFGFGPEEEGDEDEQDIADAGRVGDSIPDAEDPGNPFEAREPKTDPDILHIPCPKGHILETPRDMLNQEVMCPICEREFYLKWENSIEGQREIQKKQERHDRKVGDAWMNWAIAAAVIVGLGVIAMVAMIASS